MAACIAQHKLGSGFIIESRGIAAFDSPASPHAIKAVYTLECGTLINHRAKRLTCEDATTADLLICMTVGHVNHVVENHPQQAHKVVLLHQLFGQDRDVDDPFGASLKIYENIATEFSRLFDNKFPEILKKVVEQL